MADSTRSFSLALLSVFFPLSGWAKDAEKTIAPASPEQEIVALGGHVFRDPKSKEVIEVKLNDSDKLSDADLKLVTGYESLTDLSLENTAVTGTGLVHLARLKKIEWLNLWQTRIDDKGLAHLADLPSLKFLPIGGTKITDAGLAHLKGLPLLNYLGLRNTAITDAGVATLTALPALKELNLRNTKITNDCIASLSKIRSLRKVWLGETNVTKQGIAQLRTALPRCEINRTGDEEKNAD